VCLWVPELSLVTGHISISKTVMQWIKENGVEVLLDVIGYTDLKNCFTTESSGPFWSPARAWISL
jgi:hypothetical protein